MALTIETTDQNHTTSVILLKGELTLGPDCTRLRQLVHAYIHEGRRHLIFDLSGVAQLDSTGIGQFIDAYSRMEQVGGKMTLTGVIGPVKEAFHITRLDTVFRFAATVEEALA